LSHESLPKDQSKRRVILHVDMDAFYAAVEVREDPSLRGRPVVVGADPAGGRGRGVVATASYEARAYGIYSAMPISEAYRRCPDAAYLRPRISLYAEVSADIFDLFRRYTDLVEPLSLDEAFLDVAASRTLFGGGPEIARSLKADIVAETGLEASVGVANSKFVAKVASDLDKPDGLVVVPEDREREFLAPLEVARLWGAGPRAQEKFRRLGVQTIGDVVALGRPRLVEAFGEAMGNRFHELSRGRDDRTVLPHHGRKSLSKETTFLHDVSDRHVVETTLLRLCEDAARGLRKRGLAGSTVTVKLRWEGFETVTRQTTLETPVDTTERLWPVARELLRVADRAERRVRLIGVGVSALASVEELDLARVQLGLFGPDAPATEDRLARAVDQLRERFGSHAVTRAALVNQLAAREAARQATRSVKTHESQRGPERGPA
jgi:nucleotidyltransferase/DNA polymerase involved in DNA repair